LQIVAAAEQLQCMLYDELFAAACVGYMQIERCSRLGRPYTLSLNESIVIA